MRQYGDLPAGTWPAVRHSISCTKPQGSRRRGCADSSPRTCPPWWSTGPGRTGAPATARSKGWAIAYGTGPHGRPRYCQVEGLGYRLRDRAARAPHLPGGRCPHRIIRPTTRRPTPRCFHALTPPWRPEVSLTRFLVVLHILLASACGGSLVFQRSLVAGGRFGKDECAMAYPFAHSFRSRAPGSRADSQDSALLRSLGEERMCNAHTRARVRGIPDGTSPESRAASESTGTSPGSRPRSTTWLRSSTKTTLGR